MAHEKNSDSRHNQRKLVKIGLIGYLSNQGKFIENSKVFKWCNFMLVVSNTLMLLDHEKTKILNDVRWGLGPILLIQYFW